MQNLEAKFPISDIVAIRHRAEALGFEYVATLVQHDTFFMVADGKLKLRVQNDEAQLIYYRRCHAQGLEVSTYQTVVVQEPGNLRNLLSTALGILAELRKKGSCCAAVISAFIWTRWSATAPLASSKR